MKSWRKSSRNPPSHEQGRITPRSLTLYLDSLPVWLKRCVMFYKWPGETSLTNSWWSGSSVIDTSYCYCILPPWATATCRHNDTSRHMQPLVSSCHSMSFFLCQVQSPVCCCHAVAITCNHLVWCCHAITSCSSYHGAICYLLLVYSPHHTVFDASLSIFHQGTHSCWK